MGDGWYEGQFVMRWTDPPRILARSDPKREPHEYSGKVRGQEQLIAVNHDQRL